MSDISFKVNGVPIYKSSDNEQNPETEEILKDKVLTARLLKTAETIDEDVRSGKLLTHDQVFIDALLNPPEPNEAAKAAVERYYNRRNSNARGE